MAERPRRDAAFLLDMKLAAGDALFFVKEMDLAAFLASALHQNAAIRALEIIGEAANNVSPEFRAAHPEIPWRDIIAMRHRLIHGYADVRLDHVWSVLADDLGPLIAGLTPLIPPPKSGS